MTENNGKANGSGGNGADQQESLFEFPCDFPIKAMGRDEDNFQAHVVELITAEVGDIDPSKVSVRPSRKGQFLSVTVIFEATSRSQLDAVYRSLTSSVRILYVI